MAQSPSYNARLGATPLHPDWVMDHQYYWPAPKYGMEFDELFTTLNNRFNTYPAALQDFMAFHADVVELSHTADTKEALFSALELRKEQRSEELYKAWDDISIHLIGTPTTLTGEHWGLLVDSFRTKSLDRMLAFLFHFLSETEKVNVYNYLNGAAKKVKPVLETGGASADDGPVDSPDMQAYAMMLPPGGRTPGGSSDGVRDGERQTYDTESIASPDSIYASPRQFGKRLDTGYAMREVTPEAPRRQKSTPRPSPAPTDPNDVEEERHRSRDKVGKPGPGRPPRGAQKKREAEEPTPRPPPQGTQKKRKAEEPPPSCPPQGAQKKRKVEEPPPSRPAQGAQKKHEAEKRGPGRPPRGAQKKHEAEKRGPGRPPRGAQKKHEAEKTGPGRPPRGAQKKRKVEELPPDGPAQGAQKKRKAEEPPPVRPAQGAQKKRRVEEPSPSHLAQDAQTKHKAEEQPPTRSKYNLRSNASRGTG
ncbi:hypothetical protein F5Y14DRAFT_456893 [Nemania sp. NC0429]|nr:hypothetical protein F5Y14DRAFT_456893 [Nemania sp. NC0429]